MRQVFDIAIIGGGVNGCGIARDAAGRGLSVYLCEQGDLAGATSSASTKLIHGGLRYLEHYEFRLVHESLSERETLLKLAPHIVWPLRFVLPHHKGLRPAWLLRLGLFLYDHMGARKLLAPTRMLDLGADNAGAPLKDKGRAFEYSDCWVQDARLVVLNAMDARERGAQIDPRTKAVRATRENGLWTLQVETAQGVRAIHARALINAGGPWAQRVLDETIDVASTSRVRLVQGSHIVAPRLFAHERAYIFQNSDGRIIFAIPFESDFTLIGTTDRDYAGDPACPVASEEEIAYLIAAANEYFTRALTRADVVWTYSGVRPLYDDGASAAQEATRDYVLNLDTAEGAAPLLSIFGGKITTYRRLALAALDKLAPFFPNMRAQANWTARAALPGGDFQVDGFDALVRALRLRWPFVGEAHMRRLARAYGTRVEKLLAGAAEPQDLGAWIAGDLYEIEIRYLVREEFAQTADDILWRRSKFGLVFGTAERAALVAMLARIHDGI